MPVPAGAQDRRSPKAPHRRPTAHRSVRRASRQWRALRHERSAWSRRTSGQRRPRHGQRPPALPAHPASPGNSATSGQRRRAVPAHRTPTVARIADSAPARRAGARRQAGRSASLHSGPFPSVPGGVAVVAPQWPVPVGAGGSAVVAPQWPVPVGVRWVRRRRFQQWPVPVGARWVRRRRSTAALSRGLSTVRSDVSSHARADPVGAQWALPGGERCPAAVGVRRRTVGRAAAQQGGFGAPRARRGRPHHGGPVPRTAPRRTAHPERWRRRRPAPTAGGRPATRRGVRPPSASAPPEARRRPRCGGTARSQAPAPGWARPGRRRSRRWRPGGNPGGARPARPTPSAPWNGGAPAGASPGPGRPATPWGRTGTPTPHAGSAAPRGGARPRPRPPTARPPLHARATAAQQAARGAGPVRCVTRTCRASPRSPARQRLRVRQRRRRLRRHRGRDPGPGPSPAIARPTPSPRTASATGCRPPRTSPARARCADAPTAAPCSTPARPAPSRPWTTAAPPPRSGSPRAGAEAWHRDRTARRGPDDGGPATAASAPFDLDDEDDVDDVDDEFDDFSDLAPEADPDDHPAGLPAGAPAATGALVGARSRRARRGPRSSPSGSRARSAEPRSGSGSASSGAICRSWRWPRRCSSPSASCSSFARSCTTTIAAPRCSPCSSASC